MKKKIVAITQARMGSTRLPGKVLKIIDGLTMLEIHLNRVLKAGQVDQVVLATTDLAQDDGIAEIGKKMGLMVYRGSESDVLDRYYQAAIAAEADTIVRVTSDCPLVDPTLIDSMIKAHIENKKDFTSNVVFRTYPDGMDVEIFDFSVLKRAWKEATDKSDREHVTHYIWKNSDLLNCELFTSYNITASNGLNHSAIRLTLDYPADYDLFKILIDKLGIERSSEEYVGYLVANPDILKINS